MEKLVAKTYATALFEVAIESNQLDQIGNELEYIDRTFTQYPEFYELYKTPQISSDEKKQIIAKVFQQEISPEVMNFLKIILDKRITSVF